MLTKTFYDVNEAYTEMQTIAPLYCKPELTRNGAALVFPFPVLIEHAAPTRRVLFDPKRDANPFLHYIESIWMLAGRKDVAVPARYAKNFNNYSDDGVSMRGAYGARWRNHWSLDQIDRCIRLLREDYTTRRAVITMFDPDIDLEPGKDIPCNTQIYFREKDGALSMTVTNRSNDLVWGMLGSNIVHFSYLQEWVAGGAGLSLGSYYQFTNNLHIYDGWYGEDKWSKDDSRWYNRTNWKRIPMTAENLDLNEANDFLDGHINRDYASPILTLNARPMAEAWTRYKAGDPNCMDSAESIHDEDWCKACTEWLTRRMK